MNSRRLIQTAKLIGIQTHTELIKEFVFEMLTPTTLSFRAGQFLMLHIPNPIPGEKDILRAYSLASGEHNPSVFRLLIKYVDGGLASQYFWNLKVNQTIQFTAPFGKLFFPETPSTQLFFLSTGSGLAPHLSYIETYLEKCPENSFHFLIGVRTTKDLFYVDYLNDKKNKFRNFNFEFALSRPESTWTGKIGYLQKQIEILDFEASNCHFFICGNKEMAIATKQSLLDRGIPANKILVEIF